MSYVLLGLNLVGGGEAVTTSSEESEAVEDIEHSEESEEGASEEEDVWSRCVTQLSGCRGAAHHGPLPRGGKHGHLLMGD
jgi:hypothetical protein